MPQIGWLERPNYDQLLDTVGYVTQIWITQEGEKDELHFRLRILWGTTETSKEFCIPLYIHTTVALAQLQLLRDGLRWAWADDRDTEALAVQVHFNFRRMLNEEESYVYWVRLLSGGDGAISVDQYYGVTATTWYVYGL